MALDVPDARPTQLAPDLPDLDFGDGFKMSGQLRRCFLGSYVRSA